MPRTLEIKASNPITEDQRYEALKKINSLSDLELERLSQLADSAKARKYLTSKWNMLKKFVL